jgi:hypothetical protein
MRLWEIAENLHRSELTVLERSEHIAEWVRLTENKGAQVAQVSAKGGRGIEGGLSAATRELGIDRTEAQRSAKIDSLTAEVKNRNEPARKRTPRERHQQHRPILSANVRVRRIRIFAAFYSVFTLFIRKY